MGYQKRFKQVFDTLVERVEGQSSSGNNSSDENKPEENEDSVVDKWIYDDNMNKLPTPEEQAMERLEEKVKAFEFWIEESKTWLDAESPKW